MSNGIRIQFALYLREWVYDETNIKFLVDNAVRVTVSEHTLDMKNHLFCPECHVNLFRSPEQENVSRNGRQAFFAHSRRFTKECGLRTKRAEGFKFETEEDAKQAIENDKLVIVSHFIKDQPPQPIVDAGVYDDTAVEDQAGELTNVPISRHRGENFLLPSRVLTVRGITRQFDRNFYKYYFLPDSVECREKLTHL